jgi:hypothetical protein
MIDFIYAIPAVLFVVVYIIISLRQASRDLDSEPWRRE